MQRRLYLSRTDKKLAGVCGGIAEYFDIDATLVRLIWVLLTFAGGAGLPIYIIAAIVMQEKPMTHPSGFESERVVDVEYESTNNNSSGTKGDNDRLIIGGGLIVLGMYIFSKNFFFFHWMSFKYLGPIILVLLGFYFLFKERK